MKPTEEKIQSNTSDLPVYLFKQGNNCEAYRYFGAHLETRVGDSGAASFRRMCATMCRSKTVWRRSRSRTSARRSGLYSAREAAKSQNE